MRRLAAVGGRTGGSASPCNNNIKSRQHKMEKTSAQDLFSAFGIDGFQLKCFVICVISTLATARFVQHYNSSKLQQGRWGKKVGACLLG